MVLCSSQTFPKRLAGFPHPISIPFSNDCGPALPYSCPIIGLWLKPQLLADEPHHWASPRQSSTAPKIWLLEAPMRASLAPRGPHGLFHQATAANPSEGGKARQETIFATPKLNNYHLGCEKFSPPPQAPAPRTHQHPGRGRHRRPPAPNPRGFAEECRGRRWRGGEQPRRWEGNQLESRSLMK